MSVKKPMSFSRESVIRFIQLQSKEEMTIEIEGTESTALGFLQCMRMELSRMRGKVRDRGGVPQAFKLAFIDIKPHEKKPHTMLLTIRKKTGNEELAKEMVDILDTIDLRGIKE